MALELTCKPGQLIFFSFFERNRESETLNLIAHFFQRIGISKFLGLNMSSNTILNVLLEGQ
jgi:hypothetical protein